MWFCLCHSSITMCSYVILLKTSVTGESIDFLHKCAPCFLIGYKSVLHISSWLLQVPHSNHRYLIQVPVTILSSLLFVWYMCTWICNLTHFIFYWIMMLFSLFIHRTFEVLYIKWLDWDMKFIRPILLWWMISRFGFAWHYIYCFHLGLLPLLVCLVPCPKMTIC